MPVYRMRRFGERWIAGAGLLAALLSAVMLGRLIERTDWPLLLQAIGYTKTVKARPASKPPPTAQPAPAPTLLPIRSPSTLEPGIEPPFPLGPFDNALPTALLQRDTGQARQIDSGVDVQLDDAPLTRQPTSAVEVQLEDGGQPDQGVEPGSVLSSQAINSEPATDHSPH